MPGATEAANPCHIPATAVTLEAGDQHLPPAVMAYVAGSRFELGSNIPKQGADVHWGDHP